MATKRKQALTLLEIMIVIFLIGIIGSVVGVNMKKSMDRAKLFKTNAAKQQLEDILTFAITSGNLSAKDLHNRKKLKEVIDESGLCKNSDDLLKDGWNEYFTITYDNDELLISSSKLEAYNQKQEEKTEGKKKTKTTEDQE